MAQQSTNDNDSTSEVVAGIGSFAAAIVLWVSGVLTVLSGISVLSADRLISAAPEYVYGFNATAWGWIHIVLGVLVAAVAFGLFWGVTWARVSAVIIASLSIVSMFMWLPQYPLWSIVVIALDIFVIWAVATWQSPRQRAARTGVEDVRGPEAPQRSAEYPSWPSLHPVLGGHPIRLEGGMKDDRYEVRAELPGIDPVKDVDVSTRDGVLTIKAQRSEKRETNRSSEFAYGTFVRSVLLPPGANGDDVSVTYGDGILAVSVGISQARPAEKHIPVESGDLTARSGVDLT